jgi:membrane protein
VADHEKNSSSHSFLYLLKASFQVLGRNDPLRMAGATAFFTTFALPPILLIIIQVLGLVFDPLTIRTRIFEDLAGIIGRATVRQLINTLVAVRKAASNWLIISGGFIFLLFVATTLFKVIKGSLNQLWSIRIVKKRNLWERLRTRARSIIVILLAGLLFVIGLIGEGIQAYMGKYVFQYSQVLFLYFDSTVNFFISIVIVTAWFALLFRVLPDARAHWKIVLGGAFLTSVLFNTGKILLRWLLTYSNLKTFYGTSGSLILLLLFVFYTSLILYYGAAFTQVLSQYAGKPVKPLPYAVHYKYAEAPE